MILKNCFYYDENFIKQFGFIKIDGEIITQVGKEDENENVKIEHDGEPVIDLCKKNLLPGFIDIHIHGADGADFSDGETSSFDTISRYLVRHGVTSFCGTTMTLPNEQYKKILSNADKYNCKGAKLVGINLEGPYISPVKNGAQNSSNIRKADIEEINELLEINGNIKLITVAPEECDSHFLKEISKKITVSIGHSNADEEQFKKAVECGAKHVTHLFNAMTPAQSRQAGIVGAALDDKRVMCEIICDSHHVCETMIRNAFAVLGEERVIVISDSMRAAGLGCGEFELGGQKVYVKENDGVARLENGSIAASITNLYDEFLYLIKIGIPVSTALKACTVNPAKSIGEDKNIGSIDVGKKADLIVTDDQMNILQVIVDGKFIN